MKQPILDALEKNLASSSALISLKTTMIERVGLRWDNLPQISPSASIDSEGIDFASIGIQLPVSSFGRKRIRRELIIAELEVARFELQIEENTLAAEILTKAGEAALARELKQLLEEFQVNHLELRTAAGQRQTAGVADASETLLTELRAAEIGNDASEQASRIDLALGQIAVLTGRPTTLERIPDLSALMKEIGNVSLPQESPIIAQASVREEIAAHELRLVKARLIPALVLRGAIDLLTSQSGSAFALTVDTSDFAGLSAVTDRRLAEAALQAADASTRKTALGLARSLQDLALRERRALGRRDEVDRLVELSRNAVSLYVGQRSLGARSLSDGISIYRSLLAGEQQRLQLSFELFQIYVERARLMGALVSVSNDSELH
ncbi:TolC family protein [Frigidibacter sp. RF13]|uniref:TolC family protein n=1 Tax=Frigidibacter sp. RF13 TaxID=2997340 RepID=UPI002272213E|nr:TolC family protein [Frigidibacter sp. RF13]MCY1128731.1 TolC family protein [Frigidibacter sp. RF13]